MDRDTVLHGAGEGLRQRRPSDWHHRFRDRPAHQGDRFAEQENLHFVTRFSKGVGMQEREPSLVGSSDPQALLMSILLTGSTLNR